MITRMFYVVNEGTIMADIENDRVTFTQIGPFDSGVVYSDGESLYYCDTDCLDPEEYDLYCKRTDEWNCESKVPTIKDLLEEFETDTITQLMDFDMEVIKTAYLSEIVEEYGAVEYNGYGYLETSQTLTIMV